MILRRYGTHYRSVDAEFNSRALTEIGFRATNRLRVPIADFERRYTKQETHELAPSAAGEVQDETEALLLERLLEELNCILGTLGPDQVAVVDNGKAHDHPKTRQETDNTLAEGENRLRFRYTLAPPLRVAVYRELQG